MKAALFGALVLAAPAWAADPTLTRVTLSSGGVGQFEFSAQVDGAAALDLDVPLDQVDDLLKSLRVDDPAGAPNVRLPGRQPLAESFRTLPFGPDAFVSPHALLGALVGERVRASGPGIEGTILSVNDVETVLPNNGGTQTRHRLTIATAVGIESLVLEDSQGIEFSSETLRRQVASALTAIASQRVQDRRTLHLALAAGGARDVRFGYVVPAPVWKASYRLTVPADGVAGPTRLQGFAIVENLSGRDWKGVEVVLTSGQPVLFHTPLYEAVFTTRPDAPVEVANRLVPQVDQGAMAAGSASDQALRGMRPAPPPSPASPPMMRMAAPAAPASVAQEAAEPPPLSQVRQSAAQVEFRLASPVTAAPGESLMLPIASRDVPARRVALFQPETDPLHPLVSLLVTNDTKGAMPPGLATLFEQRGDGSAGFIGDARLPSIQPGEERLASFAADLAVRVATTRSADMLVTGAQAAAGVLTLVRRERSVTVYRASMPAGSGRTMMFEIGRRAGWTLSEPADAALAPDRYRITRDVAAGAVETVTIVLERPRSERVVLGEAGIPRLMELAQEGRLSPELRAAMTRAATLRTELDRRAVALKELRDRRGEMVADQDRIRRNLAAVPVNSELQRRYLAQLQQQENDLGTLGTQTDAAQRGVSEAEGALKAFIGSISM